MDAADEAPSTEGAEPYSAAEFVALVESQAFLDSWLSKDGEHSDHNDERGGELLQEEKARLEQLRRRDVKKLKLPELAEEVHLRARKRKSFATASDDLSYRTNNKKFWVGVAKKARALDKDPLEGSVAEEVAEMELPADKAADKRKKADTLAMWKDRSAGDDLRLCEMAMLDADEKHGDVGGAWDVFFNGITQRTRLDAGKNPIAPGVEGMQCPFLTTFFALYKDREWRPENLFPEDSAVKEVTPLMGDQIFAEQRGGLLFATDPPTWECLRLGWKDLSSRLSDLKSACEDYSGDDALDEDKMWEYAKGDTGAYYAYRRTKDRDDFNKFVTDVGDDFGLDTGKNGKGPTGESRGGGLFQGHEAGFYFA